MFFAVKIHYGKKENAQKHQKIYSSGKSPDTPGGFGFARAEKINRKII